jgi:hypothetical protein
MVEVVLQVHSILQNKTKWFDQCSTKETRYSSACGEGRLIARCARALSFSFYLPRWVGALIWFRHCRLADVGQSWSSRGRDDLADADDQQCAVSRYGRTTPPILSQDEIMLCCFSLKNSSFQALESTAVLKAICAGFKDSTETHVCLTQHYSWAIPSFSSVLVSDRYVDLCNLFQTWKMTSALTTTTAAGKELWSAKAWGHQA